MATSAKNVSAPGSKLQAQSARVLLAENDADLRAQLHDPLREAGVEIVCAGTGEEAVQQLDGSPFGLALLDLQLPQPNGLEILTCLRNRGGPRVIAMSRDDTVEAMLSAVREGAWDYFSQPFEPQLIVERVRQALSTPDAEIEVISASPGWLELEVPCQWRAAERASGFVSRMGSGLPEQMREGLATAVRELLMNAVEWGGALNPQLKARIACVRSARMMIYRVSDPGPGFRLEDVPHAAIAYPLDEVGAYDKVRQEKGMRPGGLGLMLVQALADELVFNQSRNEVIFVKYLP